MPRLLPLVVVAALLSPALLSPAQAARVTVPGAGVSVDVPAGFVRMPAAVTASKYARGTPPTAVYSTPGPSWAVNIAFALRDQALPPGDLRAVQSGLTQSIAGTPGLRWVSQGVVHAGATGWTCASGCRASIRRSTTICA